MQASKIDETQIHSLFRKQECESNRNYISKRLNSE